MQPAQHPAGRDSHRRRAGDVGAQGIAHRQHASGRQVQHLENRLIDRRIGFPQRPHIAAHGLVAQRQRSRAQHPHAVADHLQIGVAADHRQSGGPARRQDRLELGHVRGVAMVVWTGIEHELRLRGGGDLRQAQPFQHVAVARRAKMEDACAQVPPPPVRAVAQMAVDRLAAGQDVRVEIVGNAHRPHGGLRRVVAPRRVGQHHHPLAALAQPGQAVHRARIGLHPVMHDAPEIDDEAVIALGERGETR